MIAALEVGSSATDRITCRLIKAADEHAYQAAMGFVVRLVYAACLLGATVNHARIVAEHGFLRDYGGVPAASAAFWTSLTLLDPLAIILLVVRANAGVLATAVIIFADVIHDLWITARYANSQSFMLQQ